MTQDPSALPDYSSYPVTLFTDFEVDLTFINLPVDETIHMTPIVYVVHVFFTVVAAILLTNLLIAMMNDTQWRVAQERDELWRTQVIQTRGLKTRTLWKRKSSDCKEHNHCRPEGRC